ncbi:LysM peptidoglycan-binding domain-containing protein [Nocardioides panacis]|uniref:LysM peptidoglycan-binding domain-containing protein n=1 Tax=Nocardioides panacis TaxID=2849501 RepID=A0A975SW19_9ACTN|nr:LysM peptidoglycan-binding domain-containing protein [Nocardioides panacis]QWZ06339.1 LysM peptidoglycan-binding domain-containing protein [Nocardioides panacis]
MTSPTGRRSTRPRTVRWARRLTATLSATTVGGLLLLGAPVDGSRTALGAPVVEAADAGLTLTAADPHRWPGHPGRRLVGYTVRRGDTATGLAVRFHAWTRELRSLNHLGRHGRLYAGERIRIPVVVAAARRAHTHRHLATKHATRPVEAAPDEARGSGTGSRTRGHWPTSARPRCAGSWSGPPACTTSTRTWRSPSPGRSPGGSSGGSPRPGPSA